jgi:hypothetical protein
MAVLPSARTYSCGGGCAGAAAGSAAGAAAAGAAAAAAAGAAAGSGDEGAEADAAAETCPFCCGATAALLSPLLALLGSGSSTTTMPISASSFFRFSMSALRFSCARTRTHTQAPGHRLDSSHREISPRTLTVDASERQNRTAGAANEGAATKGINR